MERLYKQYLTLTAGQRKLLCFLAYTGKELDSDLIRLYAKCEDIARENVKKTANALTQYLSSYSFYHEDYLLDNYHVAPLCLYMLKVMPQWVTYFDTFYKRLQAPDHLMLLNSMRQCLDGEKPTQTKAIITEDYCSRLVPLVSYAQFFSLMKDIPADKMLAFVAETAVWQIYNDMDDPDNLLGQVARLVSMKMGPVNWGKCKSIVALYDFYKQGRYDEQAAKLNNHFACLLAGSKALYDGDYDAAFKHLTTAMRIYNKELYASEKGYFKMPLNNLMLVMAYHLKKGDVHKKLGALLKKDGFRTDSESKSVVWFAQYLQEGYVTSEKNLQSEIKSKSNQKVSRLRFYLAHIVARFFHFESAPLPQEEMPHLWILRQELERREPSLLARIRFKQKWEMLLEELTPKTEKSSQRQEATTRVAYIFNYSWVEAREQTRLKSGEWGAGKKLSWDALRRGTPYMDDADRHAAITDAKEGDVVLTTYGLFVTETDDLLGKQWNTVCLDEAHVIKNRETKTSASVMKLQARHRIILTGTPVQNHLGELWNLYQFINPGLLGSYEQFQKKYITPIEQQQDKNRSRQLKRIVQPFILRRTKQEVIEELPDKTEITLPVELSDDELAVYEVIRRRAKKLLEDEQGGAVSVNTLAEITRLRQAACAAQLAEKSWTGDSSKIQALLSLLEEIVGGGNSVLVFSQFTSFLALVREALDKTKADYVYLDGTVPMKKREQLVQSFQRGEHPVFLISLKAGGLGLNLTGANYVIHLDPWWNPAIEQQATDRAYRIGQRQNVTVYHLISQHTIEEKILRLHETKRNLADAMLEGTSESHKLNASDLLGMLDAASSSGTS